MMPKKTQTKQKEGQATNNLSLYDVVMSALEPDLTTVNFEEHKLAKRYENESNEEKKERYERYEEALKHFDEALSRLERSYLHQARKHKEEVSQKVQEQAKQEKTEEQKKLREMEKYFESTD